MYILFGTMLELYIIWWNNEWWFSDPSVDITKIQEVAIGNFIPHPATVTAIALTSITGIRTETGILTC